MDSYTSGIMCKVLIDINTLFCSNIFIEVSALKEQTLEKISKRALKAKTKKLVC